MIIVMIISVNLSGYAADLVMKIWFGNIVFFVKVRAFPLNFYFCSCTFLFKPWLLVVLCLTLALGTLTSQAVDSKPNALYKLE